MTRRDFVISTQAAALKSPAPGRKIVVALLDGFGPEYLERSEMPNLKRMIAGGFHKTARGVIPSVTNVNNASLVT